MDGTVFQYGSFVDVMSEKKEEPINVKMGGGCTVMDDTGMDEETKESIITIAKEMGQEVIFSNLPMKDNIRMYMMPTEEQSERFLRIMGER